MAATRSAGVRRLMREATELSSPTDMYVARPLEDNLFEWHFTIRGPPDSPYEGGIYHGRITLPHDYPMKPPSLMMLTPNGRFETNTKICLSISAYHPETWLPSWSIGTALVALIAFMTTPGKGAVGALECSEEQRKKLAKESLTWGCSDCGCIMKELFELMKEQADKKPKNELPDADGDAKPEEEISEIPREDPVLSITEESTATNDGPHVILEPPKPVVVHQPQPIQAPFINHQQGTTATNAHTGFLIIFFTAIFLGLLLRRLTSMA